MFARKIQVEVVGPHGPRPCPLAWLDNYCMRSFTGRSAFDETLPISDGLMEASLRVDLELLRGDMEDWMTRKFGEGSPVKLRLS
jgi:transposase